MAEVRDDRSVAGIRSSARTARGLRSYIVKTCRRILTPGFEQRSPPVRALRRIFGNYLEVTAAGLPLIVDLRDAVVSYGIIADGAWEPEETALVRRLLRPGDHVVDVGAHIGYYTVVFAQAVAPSGTVLAFEPAQENADLLQINVALNGFEGVVTLVRAAAGSDETMLELVHDVDHAASHSDVSNRGGHYVRPAAGSDVRAVRVTTIDAATASWERVDAVKIDVEGHEWHVLQGMRRTLARNVDFALFTEFWPAGIRRAGADPAAYLTQLEDEGFQVWEIQRPGGLAAVKRAELLGRLSGAGDLADLVCVRGAFTQRLDDALAGAQRA